MTLHQLPLICLPVRFTTQHLRVYHIRTRRCRHQRAHIWRPTVGVLHPVDDVRGHRAPKEFERAVFCRGWRLGSNSTDHNVDHDIANSCVVRNNAASVVAGCTLGTPCVSGTPFLAEVGVSLICPRLVGPDTAPSQTFLQRRCSH